MVKQCVGKQKLLWLSTEDVASTMQHLIGMLSMKSHKPYCYHAVVPNSISIP